MRAVGPPTLVTCPHSHQDCAVTFFSRGGGAGGAARGALQTRWAVRKGTWGLQASGLASPQAGRLPKSGFPSFLPAAGGLIEALAS